MTGQLLVLAGSIAAVLVLGAIAWLLRLGGARIESEAQARETAEAMLSGFTAGHAVIGSDGAAALVHGEDGSVALLKVHGARIAARRLHLPLATRATAEGLTIDSGERRFGAVLLRGTSSLGL